MGQRRGLGLYLITKLQNLKAIHNEFPPGINGRFVVSNYKITKSESYSQQGAERSHLHRVVSNYKITKSESYSQPTVISMLPNWRCI